MSTLHLSWVSICSLGRLRSHPYLADDDAAKADDHSFAGDLTAQCATKLQRSLNTSRNSRSSGLTCCTARIERTFDVNTFANSAARIIRYGQGFITRVVMTREFTWARSIAIEAGADML